LCCSRSFVLRISLNNHANVNAHILRISGV
jgi:hypothetical protein